MRGIPSGDNGIALNFAEHGSLPKWIVVAGRNGAGKSTFLQALALSIAGPSVARLLAETFSGWIRDSEQSALAAAKLRFGDEDGFAAGRKPTFAPWTAISWHREPDGPEPGMTRFNLGGKWTPWRGPWADNPRGWFIAGYGPFRRLSPAPTEAQRLMMLPGRPAGLASLFREDASLSESVRWLQQIYLRRLEKNETAKELENLVMTLLDDGLLPEGMRVQRVDSVGLWVRTRDGQDLALNSLSDGYRTVAALVLDLVKQLVETFTHIDVSHESGAVQIMHEGVVLIDEVDVHLHVEWQQRIGFWLKQHFPNIQFIVTTHSPFICQAADEGGLLRLSPAWEPGPAAQILEGEAFNRVVNGTADDAIMSELFGLDSVRSPRSRTANERLAALEAKLATTSLPKNERLELEQLRQTVSHSQAELAERALYKAGTQR